MQQSDQTSTLFFGRAWRVLLVLLGLFGAGCQLDAADRASSLSFHSPPFQVADLYPSMLGPIYENFELKLEDGKPELCWVTGFEADMVGEDIQERKSQEFNCHNTLSYQHSGAKQRAFLGAPTAYGSRRLFTISQGQRKVEFPEGFGIPLISTQKLALQSQILNLHEERIGEKVRHSVRVHYKRDRELKRPMTPLMLVEFSIAVPIESTDSPTLQEARALRPGCDVNAGGNPIMELWGEKVTTHWYVPPGRDVRTTYMGNPFEVDSRIHYFAAHVHPYLKSFELWDVTTKKRVIRVKGEQADDTTELTRLTSVSNAKGIPVYRDHEYMLRSIYDNTSSEPVTAMAFAFCYLEDKQFRKPTPELIRELATEEFCNGRESHPEPGFRVR